METIIASLDTYWFAVPAFIVLLGLLVLYIYGTPAQPEYDEESDRLIEAYFDAQDQMQAAREADESFIDYCSANVHYNLISTYGEAIDE